VKITFALLAAAGVASLASADEVLTAQFLGSAPIGSPAVFGPQENVPRYSNVTNFTGQAFSNGGAVGGITRLVADDISRTGNAGEALTEFTFSVSNLNTANVSARARVRFYAADGVGGAPGTYITGYSFNPISFVAGSVNTYTTGLLAGGAAMPLNFWAGITFDNVGTGISDAQLNLLGQGIFSPPTLGSSGDVAFQTNAAGSFLVSNPAGGSFNFQGQPAANFGWRVSTVPTPGAMALLGLGGLAVGRRRR
jgi:MYXO-CTERM domain-containing protein